LELKLLFSGFEGFTSHLFIVTDKINRTRNKYSQLTLSELRLMLIDVLTFEFNSNGQKFNERYRANPQEMLFVLPYGSSTFGNFSPMAVGAIKTEVSRPISLTLKLVGVCAQFVLK